MPSFTMAARILAKAFSVIRTPFAGVAGATVFVASSIMSTCSMWRPASTPAPNIEPLLRLYYCASTAAGVAHIPLLLPVVDRRPDGIFRQHRAVNLHRRKRQLLDDVRVLDRKRLIHRFALHPLRG